MKTSMAREGLSFPAQLKMPDSINRSVDMRAVSLTILAIMLIASNAAHAAPSIETLPSGVKIEHVKIGEGSAPTASS